MKLLAIKVSGRKQLTTTILLNMALEGAASKGARQNLSACMTLIFKDAQSLKQLD